jgi:hypothetical protein
MLKVLRGPSGDAAVGDFRRERDGGMLSFIEQQITVIPSEQMTRLWRRQI